MSIPQSETSVVDILVRLEEVERANTRMAEELATLQKEHPSVNEQAHIVQVFVSKTPEGQEEKKASGKPKDRRGLLRKVLAAAAVVVGAGTLLEVSKRTALANGSEGPTTFSSDGDQVSVTAIHSNINTVFETVKIAGSGYGIIADSVNGNGVRASSSGTLGPAASAAVLAQAASSTGVYATTKQGGTGVYGQSDSGIGIQGQSDSSTAIYGQSNSGWGVYGQSESAVGVEGKSKSATGVYATGGNIGLYAQSDNVGVQVHNTVANGNDVFLSTPSNAGFFGGNVNVTGTLSKGGGSFQIDHPLDPANMYLFHSFVESPDMKNIYDGVVALDSNGEAEVTLPDWFGTLNTDFRYQLTCLGGYAPIYIAQTVQSNQFKIAGGKEGMAVSWQVTGIRQDAWANAHRIPVEQDKPVSERGYYLHPDLYGELDSKNVKYTRYAELNLPM